RTQTLRWPLRSALLDLFAVVDRLSVELLDPNLRLEGHGVDLTPVSVTLEPARLREEPLEHRTSMDSRASEFFRPEDQLIAEAATVPDEGVLKQPGIAECCTATEAERELVLTGRQKQSLFTGVVPTLIVCEDTTRWLVQGHRDEGVSGG